MRTRIDNAGNCVKLQIQLYNYTSKEKCPTRTLPLRELNDIFFFFVCRRNSTWWKRRSALERGLTVMSVCGVLITIGLIIGIEVIATKFRTCDKSLAECELTLFSFFSLFVVSSLREMRVSTSDSYGVAICER